MKQCLSLLSIYLEFVSTFDEVEAVDAMLPAPLLSCCRFAMILIFYSQPDNGRSSVALIGRLEIDARAAVGFCFGPAAFPHHFTREAERANLADSATQPDR